MRLNRRTWLALAGSYGVADRLTSPSAAAISPGQPIGLGFSLYGMPKLPWREALAVCREIGYDSVELALLSGGATDSAALSTPELKTIRDELQRRKLVLPAVMDNLPCDVDAKRHEANLERIRRAAQVVQQLKWDQTPVLETVLGGKPGEWPQVRERFVERLGAWARVAEQHELVIAVKPHVGNALNTPNDARWLIDQVQSPSIKLAFDYSHYDQRGIALTDALDTLVRDVRFIHLKDRKPNVETVQFVLPGEGAIDYVDYFRQLMARGYKGQAVVEVSAQLHKQPQYDARQAAEQSYQHLFKALKQAQTPR